MSTIGKILKVTTFGESHGIGVGCIIEGIPPNLNLNIEEIQYQLNRRKPNQNSLLSPRNEPDIVEIYSGIQDNKTLGTPISLIVKNIDIKAGDYKSFSIIPRPGHADLTYLAKYGVKSSSGGGRASARETVARVAAGAAIEKFLKIAFDCEIISFVSSIGNISIPRKFEEKLVLLKKNKINFDKNFLDNIGTFIIYQLKSSDHKKSTNYEDNMINEKEEKWILVNKLINKAYLFLTQENKLIDLGYEFLLNEDNSLLSQGCEENNKKAFEINEDYKYDLNKIINLLNNSCCEIENDDIKNGLLFEDFIDEIIDDNLKSKLSAFYLNIKEKKFFLKNIIIFKNDEYVYSESINIRCPHVSTAAKIIKQIFNIKKEKDSIGGIATCVIKNTPRSLGEPCFDKFEAELAKAMLSIPATKGFEIGSGFEGTKLKYKFNKLLIIILFLKFGHFYKL